MSKIQELLAGRNDRIDYSSITTSHPWIIAGNQNCILSPDSDGLLCGLLMSHFLNWKIVGYYDGKVLLLNKRYSPVNCIFLDMEIYRENIRSVGHHMVQYNKKTVPATWDNYKNCIQPNLLRDYDGKNDFRLKYPLATIHLLLGILGSQRRIDIETTAICPLLFTDGTFQNLFSYPENVLNWLHYLRADEANSPLKTLFENDTYTVFSLMKAMDNFFGARDEISIPRERGDRLRISTSDGEPTNIVKADDYYKLSIDAKGRIEKFIRLLSTLTTWGYLADHWTWEGFKLHKFTKSDFQGDKTALNNRNFAAFMEKNPLSWAMTSGLNIEYTLENPDTLG